MTLGQKFHDEVTRIVSLFWQAGLALAATGSSLTMANGVETVTFSNDKSYRIDSSVNSYLLLLSDKQFTVLLSDGGLIQYTYGMRDGRLVFHRLLFFPCPILFEKEEIQDMSLEELIDGMPHAELVDRMRLHAPMRFDFSPDHAAENHSASHLHLRSDSRIPISGPITPSQFTRFIVRYFYPNEYKARFRRLQSPAHAATVTAHDQRDLHFACSFAWRRVPTED